MPLDYGSRNLISGNNTPFIPLVTDNPSFKVAIIPVDGRFEEKPNPKDGSKGILAIKIGDTVRGEVLSDLKKSGKRVIGKVLQIQQRGGEIAAYKVLDQRGDDVLVDPTTAVKIDLHTDSDAGNVNTNPVVESRNVLLYEEWKFENRR
jgi:hypothetical protein